jgi:hypothetical protein
MLHTFIMCDHVIITLISTHWVLVTVPRPQPTQRMSTLQGRRTDESQSSYSVEQADIFQYQSYSHSDDILKSNIKTDTSISVFSRENHMIQNIQNTLPQNIVHK